MNKMKNNMYNVERYKTREKFIAWLFIPAAAILLLISLWFLPSDLQATTSNVPIDNWSSTTSLPVDLGAVNAITHNDTIYLIGGRQLDGAPTNKVHRSTINADGTVGSWSTTSSLPIKLYLHSVSATDTHVYVIGGWKGSSPVQKRVYRAPFMANGNLGAWVNTSSDYPTKIDLHGSVIINDGLYSIGGFNGDAAVSTVYYSSIDTNGNLSTWTTRTALPQALYRHAVTAHNGYIYVTGGVDINRTAQSVVYYAKVNSDGTLGSWQNGPSLPKPLYYHRVVIHDGNLVVIAGKDDTSEFSAVYSAAINTNNGSLDNWTAEPSLPISLYRFAAVSVEKYGSEYIYVIGGFSSGKVQTDVYHSAAPPTPTPTTTPTPTPTNTPTPTPTPPAIVYASLSNQPPHWVGIGQDVVYTIMYGNNGVSAVSNATINSVIPANTELVSGTVTGPTTANVSASSAGGLISWNIGVLPPGMSGSVTYTVRRIQPPPSTNTDSVLDLEIQGPTTAMANRLITYTLSVMNQGILLENAQAFVTLPLGSTYIRSSNNGTLIGDTIKWDLQTLPESSAKTLTFVLSAPQTIIINNYSAQAEIPGYLPPNNMATTIEDEILITDINGTPPTGAGDSITILNSGTTFSWDYNGQPGNISLDSVTNPAVGNSQPQGIYSYLPLINR